MPAVSCPAKTIAMLSINIGFGCAFCARRSLAYRTKGTPSDSALSALFLLMFTKNERCDVVSAATESETV
ncbi:hypothetical protein EMIHUDRAFT_249440 [Emiliania huxleyi CCMP1516]|uniref:Secreted protein n=2 Tax=Emiliania huxleyi TaxID=2903 RepID=A0A0D3I8N6_EMIH1|nr:hypothetical protein EMIHUDRAFT_249440 [Emiliania huxleyi CCMP1516]EOD07621.1 hypothetical protein EMIHUDRAFT_249440 [Emiliania huxleyi CCMP1516]|eukprot:XP_005760050.1 hypothetical protein EMIHUDRAFT_249440 [Emiliania huxleyi CCMP1516]